MIRSPGPRLVLATAAVLAAAADVRAQADLRDVLTLKSGKQLTGRVATPFADEIVLLQGGKRVRIARADVAEQDLVSNRVREFLQQKKKLGDRPRAQSMLIEWADSHGLPGLAQLQALQICLERDEAFAHERLGHRQRDGHWSWPHEGKWHALPAFENALAADPLVLPGERFRVRIDGNLRAGVEAALELELLAVIWFDRFGATLRLEEVLQPIEVRVTTRIDDFPKWGFRPLPYFVPPPHGDEARTYYESPSDARPRQLGFVGTQALLYRTLIGTSITPDDRNRVVPWIEIGLPAHMEHLVLAERHGAAPSLALVAGQALQRELDLPRLQQQPMYGGWYLADDRKSQALWTDATMLVHFLLREDAKETRAKFLEYVHAALAERRGDSATQFESVLGRRIEQFEEPLRQWLETQAGIRR